MKKFLFFMLCIAFFFSCKKEESSVPSSNYNTHQNPHGNQCWRTLKVYGQLFDANTGLPLDQKMLNELTWPSSLLRNDTTDVNGNFGLFMGYQPCGTIGVLHRPYNIHVKLVGDSIYVLDSVVAIGPSIVNDSVWVNLYAYPN